MRRTRSQSSLLTCLFWFDDSNGYIPSKYLIRRITNSSAVSDRHVARRPNRRQSSKTSLVVRSLIGGRSFLPQCRLSFQLALVNINKAAVSRPGHRHCPASWVSSALLVRSVVPFCTAASLFTTRHTSTDIKA